MPGFHGYSRPSRDLVDVLAGTEAQRPEEMPQELWDQFRARYDALPDTRTIDGVEVRLKHASTNEYMRRLAQNVRIMGLDRAVAEAGGIAPHRFASAETHKLAGPKRMYRLTASANPDRMLAKLVGGGREPKESLEHFYIRTGQR